MDIIKFKNSDKEVNINNLAPDSLQIGELALIRESNHERLYCKNTNNEIAPLHRLIDCGAIDLPTIQEAWIDGSLAQWMGDTVAMNQVKFNTNLMGNFTPPPVSDISRLTDMRLMFSDCTGLTSLSITNFDTSNVRYMSNMFSGCTNLLTLDLSNFDTSNVTQMPLMFSMCSGLTFLDICHFNTSKVVSMQRMFNACSGLTTIDLGSFDTSNVVYINSMFHDCSGMTSLDLSHFNTSKVTDMSNMFFKCVNLEYLDVSNFDISNVVAMPHMFYKCDKIKNIRCRQSFKDWCITNQSTINLPTILLSDSYWTIVD